LLNMSYYCIVSMIATLSNGYLDFAFYGIVTNGDSKVLVHCTIA
jgi:hypothetical protein